MTRQVDCGPEHKNKRVAGGRTCLDAHYYSLAQHLLSVTLSIPGRDKSSGRVSKSLSVSRLDRWM